MEKTMNFRKAITIVTTCTALMISSVLGADYHDGKIEKLYVEGTSQNNAVVVKLVDKPEYLVLQNNQSNFDQLYALFLAAYMNDKSVFINVNEDAIDWGSSGKRDVITKAHLN